MKKTEREYQKEIRSLRTLLANARKEVYEERRVSADLRTQIRRLSSEVVIEWCEHEDTETCGTNQALGDFNTGDTILIIGEVLEASKCRNGNSTVIYKHLRTERRRKP